MRNLHSFSPKWALCMWLQAVFQLSPLVFLTLLVAIDCLSGLWMTRRITCSPIFSPTPPTPFRFCQQMHFVFQSDCGRSWIESFRKQTPVFQPYKDFLLVSPQVHFLYVDIKGFQKSFDIALFFFLHSSAATRLHFPKQDLCWRTALSVFFCQGPLLLIIHCLTLSDPAVVTGFTTRSLVVLQGEVSQDELVTDRWIQT